jgi:hypothetical protein
MMDFPRGTVKWRKTAISTVDLQDEIWTRDHLNMKTQGQSLQRNIRLNKYKGNFYMEDIP